MGARRPDFVAATSRLTRIGLDTSACIYLLENAAPWAALVRGLLDRAAAGSLRIELTALVQLELLIRPLRSGSRFEAGRVLTLTERTAGVVTADISRRVIFITAQIRAATRLSVPDALVVASAASSSCQAVVGNDRRFEAVNRLGHVDFLTGGYGRLSLPEYIHLNEYVDDSTTT